MPSNFFFCSDVLPDDRSCINTSITCPHVLCVTYPYAAPSASTPALDTRRFTTFLVFVPGGLPAHSRCTTVSFLFDTPTRDDFIADALRWDFHFFAKLLPRQLTTCDDATASRCFFMMRCCPWCLNGAYHDWFHSASEVPPRRSDVHGCHFVLTDLHSLMNSSATHLLSCSFKIPCVRFTLHWPSRPRSYFGSWCEM